MKHVKLWNTLLLSIIETTNWKWFKREVSNCVDIKVSNKFIIIITILEGILSSVFQGLRQSLTEIKKIPTEERTIVVWLFFLCSFLQLMSHIRYRNLPNCKSGDLFSCETNNNICTCLFSHFCFVKTSQSFGIYSIPECYWMHLSYRLHPHLSVKASICACKKRKLEPKYSVDWIRKFLNYSNEWIAFLVVSLSSVPLSKGNGLWRVL